MRFNLFNPFNPFNPMTPDSIERRSRDTRPLPARWNAAPRMTATLARWKGNANTLIYDCAKHSPFLNLFCLDSGFVVR